MDPSHISSSWRCLGIEPGSLSTIAQSCGGYRTVVMDYYQECISKYKNEIFLEVRKSRVPDELTIDDKIGDDVVQSLPSFSEDEKGDDNITMAQSVAMEKRNKRQAASAQKEMKRCGETAIRNGAA